MAEQKQEERKGKVLITGVSGFLGGYVLKECLKQGYRVRGTVRKFDNHKQKYSYLYDCQIHDNTLELVRADMVKDDINHWKSIIKDCQYVIHTAAPLQEAGVIPTDDNFTDVVIPGLNKILPSCKHNKIKRLIYTSSVVALGEQQNQQSKNLMVLNEESWGDIDVEINAYSRAKIRAERLLWEYIAKNDNPFQCVAINACYFFGPTLSKRNPLTNQIVKLHLNYEFPLGLMPDWGTLMGDVRDVAVAHVNAIKSENSDGKRYIVGNHFMSFQMVARCLKNKYSALGYNISLTVAPSWMVRLLARIDPVIEQNLETTLDCYKSLDCTPCQRDLNVIFRPMHETVEECADSLIKYGHINPPNKNKMQQKLIKIVIGVGIIASATYIIHKYTSYDFGFVSRFSGHVTMLFQSNK